MPKVPIKQTVFWKKRLSDWWEFDPTDGSKSPPSTLAKCHMADSRSAYFTKIHIFPTWFHVFLAEQLLHCYHVKHTWRDICKKYWKCHVGSFCFPLQPQTFLVPHKCWFLAPPMAPSGSTGRSLGRTFGEASLHVRACIPWGFRKGCRYQTLPFQ